MEVSHPAHRNIPMQVSFKSFPHADVTSAAEGSAESSKGSGPALSINEYSLVIVSTWLEEYES